MRVLVDLHLLPDLERTLGVTATSAPTSETIPEACTSRDNCASPMRGGVRVRRGASNGPICTTAFHVQVGSDEQFLSAAHCDQGAADNWYHQGLNQNDCGAGGAVDCVGKRLTTLWANGGYDVMRVQIADDQDSSLIYGWATSLTTDEYGVVGDPICGSLGNTAVVDCGTVADAYAEWNDGTYTVIGADHNDIATMGGDSGSPIVLNISGYKHVAIGSHATASGKYVRVPDALNIWGISIR